MANTYTHEELQKMIQEVEGDIESLVKSEADSLKKWEASKSMSASESSASASNDRATEAQKKENSASASTSRDTEAQKKEGSACAPAGVPKTTDAANGGLKKAADDPAADAGATSALPSEGSAAPGAGPSDASAPPADAAPAGDPAAPAPGAEQQATPEELQAAYGSLSPEEQDMHMQALQAVIQARSASMSGAPPASPAASAAPAPSASAPPAGGAAPMPGADSPAVAPDFAKSEQLQAELADLRKSTEMMGQILQVVLAKPSFKSVTGEDSVTKSEQNFASLTKGEITERLGKRARQGLSPADSQLLKSFYKNEAKVADIAHLLADK